MFLFDEEEIGLSLVRIKVVGVGGGGGNAVNNMILHNLKGVDFLVANTDRQVLHLSHAPYKIQLGEKLTKGRGAGADPQVGRDAALESVDAIRESLADSEMVFVAASLGGGTGTGAAPVIANIAKELGALTVGVVTKPFLFEAGMKTKLAEEGLREMKKGCHSVIVIPNQRLLNIVEKGTSLKEAFLVADDILRQAVAGITDLIMMPGQINVDFSDVRAIMSYPGRAVMGMGVSKGENRAVEAAQSAISSPLLEDSSIEGAKGILMNISGGRDMGLHEVAEAAAIITGKVDSDAKVIFGTAVGATDSEEVKVTVIATGFQGETMSDEVGDGRPVKKGLSADIEKRGVLRKVPRVVGGGAYNNGAYNEEVLDMPTFLRQQAD
ncbi:MAG: cell division protein FtsZ [Nitrospirae bacterium]|nr:cell division protein FtsZ [Candidatus Troglogloeales bacterium]MBI3598014.1 cell division protein FtsZ [Candidatus Troglogloeales bacterium]